MMWCSQWDKNNLEAIQIVPQDWQAFYQQYQQTPMRFSVSVWKPNKTGHSCYWKITSSTLFRTSISDTFEFEGLKCRDRSWQVRHTWEPFQDLLHTLTFVKQTVLTKNKITNIVRKWREGGKEGKKENIGWLLWSQVNETLPQKPTDCLVVRNNILKIETMKFGYFMMMNILSNVKWTELKK
jgi:hypothetical protein